jgi:YVTN family beta-propeller protein
VGIDVLRQILNLEAVNRGGIRLGVVGWMSLAIANVEASTPITQHAYVGNCGNNTVAVIDTATQTVINTVPVGSYLRRVGSGARCDNYFPLWNAKALSMVWIVDNRDGGRQATMHLIGGNHRPSDNPSVRSASWRLS